MTITYAWLTDIHLDCVVDDARRMVFAESVRDTGCTGVIITGDISTAPNIVFHLSQFERIVQRPVYFVCGNHDAYKGSIADVRTKLKELSNISSFLKYLSVTGFVSLSNKTALVGHDGWYDALNGKPRSERFDMSDWYLISEYRDAISRSASRTEAIINVSRGLAQEAVDHMALNIKNAVSAGHKNIIVATHVPPFQEAHIFEGKVGDAVHQPWFTSRLMGETLKSAAGAYPHVSFTVLCGHTHGAYEGTFAHNLKVLVGGAEYSKPAIQRLIDVA